MLDVAQIFFSFLTYIPTSLTIAVDRHDFSLKAGRELDRIVAQSEVTRLGIELVSGPCAIFCWYA